MTDELTPDARRRRRTLLLLAAGGATTALLAAGSVGAFAAAGNGTGTATPKTSATASPGTGARPSRPVHKPHMDGTVTAVSGSTVTITDRDGFTREIKVSATTTYTDGLTSAPKVGDKIHAEGTVDTDKTSLDATTIRLMSEHMRPGERGSGGPAGNGGPAGHARPGGHGPGNPGGPGPSGTPAPRPSGSTTPSPSTNP